MEGEPELHAVIGIWTRGEETYFIKRSEQMENYPDVWTLFSIQYEPDEIDDPKNLGQAQIIMNRMSEERLYGSPVTVNQHILTEESDENPIDTYVHLDLYEIEFPQEPSLNPRYYVGGEWLTLDEYASRNTSETCGSCMRMYWDWAWMQNKVDKPFPTELRT